MDRRAKNNNKKNSVCVCKSEREKGREIRKEETD